MNEFKPLDWGSSSVGIWKKNQITTKILSYSSVFSKSWWINVPNEFTQRKDSRYLWISGCPASISLLNSNLFPFGNSLFHARCSLGNRIVLGTYPTLVFRSREGPQTLSPPLAGRGSETTTYSGQSEPLDLEKVTQEWPAVEHTPKYTASYMLLLENVDTHPPRGLSVFPGLKPGRTLVYQQTMVGES